MMNENSINKRENVKKDYDLIAEAYSKDFGKEYEDMDVILEFMNKLNHNAKILDLE